MREMVTTALLSLALASASTVPTDLVPAARVTHPPLDEMSGLARSTAYPGLYWAHNDSGDSSRIFAINLKGDVIFRGWENRKADAGVTAEAPKQYEGIEIKGAGNLDWEDITTDGDNLYIAETGNNGNARRDLGVYVVKEPNPLEVNGTRYLTYWPIRYPDQTSYPGKPMHFDCEAVFWLRGKLFFLTKWRNAAGGPADGTALYRLDHPQADRVNTLRKLDERTGIGGWVTAAEVSPNGRFLAVLVQAPSQQVDVFDTRAPQDRFLQRPVGRVEFTGARQCEAIAWETDSTVIVTNEQRDLFRVTLPFLR